MGVVIGSQSDVYLQKTIREAELDALQAELNEIAGEREAGGDSNTNNGIFYTLAGTVCLIGVVVARSFENRTLGLGVIFGTMAVEGLMIYYKCTQDAAPGEARLEAIRQRLHANQ